MIKQLLHASAYLGIFTTTFILPLFATDPVSFAIAQLGKRYDEVPSAVGPGYYDCSGLTKAAYAQVGMVLPHQAAVQATLGQPVVGPYLPGDLLFFNTFGVPGTVTHVGIYETGNTMIDANSYYMQVIRDNFTDSYWAPKLLFARRYLSTPVVTLYAGSAGTMTIALSSITFDPDPASNPAGPPWNGEVAIGTNLKFATCPSGILGTPGCLDATPFSPSEAINFGNGVPITIGSGLAPSNPFIQFAGNGTTHSTVLYTLTQLGPGSANTNCTAAVHVGDLCSMFAGSPVILTNTSVGTSISISVAGTVTDGSEVVTWSGQFQALMAGKSPAQIQTSLCTSGTCTAVDFAAGRTLSIYSTFVASSPSTGNGWPVYLQLSFEASSPNFCMVVNNAGFAQVEGACDTFVWNWSVPIGSPMGKLASVTLKLQVQSDAEYEGWNCSGSTTCGSPGSFGTIRIDSLQHTCYSLNSPNVSDFPMRDSWQDFRFSFDTTCAIDFSQGEQIYDIQRTNGRPWGWGVAYASTGQIYAIVDGR